jgi:hypothetical protein
MLSFPPASSPIHDDGANQTNQPAAGFPLLGVRADTANPATTAARCSCMLCLCYKTRPIATIILPSKLVTNPSRPICDAARDDDAPRHGPLPPPRRRRCRPRAAVRLPDGEALDDVGQHGRLPHAPRHLRGRLRGARRAAGCCASTRRGTGPPTPSASSAPTTRRRPAPSSSSAGS